MRIIEGDLWEEISTGDYDAVLIPTNGAYKASGEAIMGAGVARQAKDRYPSICPFLGKMLKANLERMDDEEGTNRIAEPWNVPYKIGKTENDTLIFSFPTKPTWAYTSPDNYHIVTRYRQEAKGKERVPGWQSKSSLPLIDRSARLISAVTREFSQIALPTVGTGQGELTAKEVIEVLEAHFDDRFVVVVK